MFSTPLSKGALVTSTPVQPLDDSGFFGSSEKYPLEFHTLSPIKEISNCPRSVDLFELPKFKLFKELDSISDSNEVIRELNFDSSDFFKSRLKKRVDTIPSFQFDLSESSDEGICVLSQISSNRPSKKGLDSKEFCRNVQNYLISLRTGQVDLKPKLESKVDFLKELEHKNMYCITNKILSLVGAADLCKMSCVNKFWNKIIHKDVDANRRRKKYVKKIKSQKENLTQSRGVEKSRELDSSSLSNGALYNKANFVDASQKPVQKQVRSRFDSFLKEGKTCKESMLFKCPKCKYAAKELYKSLCVCTECKHAFCRMCLAPFRSEHKCAPTKELPIIVGSRVSKRNLKRL